jgi:hypothetical protein
LKDLKNEDLGSCKNTACPHSKYRVDCIHFLLLSRLKRKEEVVLHLGLEREEAEER